MSIDRNNPLLDEFIGGPTAPAGGPPGTPPKGGNTPSPSGSFDPAFAAAIAKLTAAITALSGRLAVPPAPPGPPTSQVPTTLPPGQIALLIGPPSLFSSLLASVAAQYAAAASAAGGTPTPQGTARAGGSLPGISGPHRRKRSGFWGGLARNFLPKRLQGGAKRFIRGWKDFRQGEFSRGFKGMKAGAKGVASSVAGKATSQAFGSALAGVVSFGTAAFTVGKVVIGLGDAAKASSEKIVEAARKYEHSVGMVMVLAQRDMQELFRNMEKGNRLASSVRGVTESEQRLKDNTKELDIFLDRVGNTFQAMFNDLASAILEPLNEIVKLVNEILDGEKEDEFEEASVGEWVQAIERDVVKMRDRHRDMARRWEGRDR